MKKTLVFLFAVIFAIPGFSQEKSDRAPEKNVFKVNTLALFLGTGSIFYERKFSDMTSAQMGVAYMSFKLSDTRFSGLILTPEFRIYPRKGAIDGFYFAPYFRYQNYSVKEAESKGTLTSLGGGIALGRQWITKSGFTMDLFFGGHYASASAKVTEGPDVSFNDNVISGFRTRVGFAIGFAF